MEKLSEKVRATINPDEALARAIKKDNMSGVIKALRDGADASIIYDDESTPLIIAVDNAGPEIIKVLIEYNANIGDAMHMAVLNSTTDSLKTLIDLGLNVNDRSFCGFTPLYNAVTNDNLEAIRLLLDNGARTARIHPDVKDILELTNNKETIALLQDHLLKKSVSQSITDGTDTTTAHQRARL